MNELGKKLTCDPQIHFSFQHHQNAFQPQPRIKKEYIIKILK